VKAGVSRQSWRAEVLRRDFLERFARRGYLFSMRDINTFGLLIDERYAADYSNENFTARRAHRLLLASEDLCSRLKKVMDDV
jgi:hypothetical protein